jgi:hypothetical protein
MYSQVYWQEHLSHDRIAYTHHGHFAEDGKIALLMGNEKTPMNTLELISGNTKKVQEVIRDYFTFETRTTRTGLGSKEILLIKAHDYDISGYGAFSIHAINDSLFIKDIQADIDFYYTDVITVEDAHILGGLLEDKECIADGNRYFLTQEDEILSVIELEEKFAYHEGLDGEVFQVSGDVPTNGSTALGAYDQLLNNSFKNELIERISNTLNRYSYNDFSFLHTDILMDTPIDIQFIEGGLYYLLESDDSYSVYYYSDENSVSGLFYELQKNRGDS